MIANFDYMPLLQYNEVKAKHMKSKRRVTIAVITCYHRPDYVRARTLRAALQSLPGVRVLVIKNEKRGWLRYPEVVWKVGQAKRQQQPDVYLLTFRGQEILPAILAIAGRKPVWFDEFIVPLAYATGERHKRSPAAMLKHFLARFSAPIYRLWLQRCTLVFADTHVHAELSARVNRVNLRKYVAIPVGTDETVFTSPRTRSKPEHFQVFYYSTGMQPLHGIPVVLAAAEQLQKQPIEFLIVGGKKPMERAVQAAQQRGAKVRYERWVQFDELAQIMQTSTLCLGGPFGGTPQAEHVITGKTYQMLAAGRPVVVGASPATAAYFTHRQNALIVPQGDADALAKTILWAYQHPSELRQIAERGQALYAREFSIESIARLLRPLVLGL